MRSLLDEFEEVKQAEADVDEEVSPKHNANRTLEKHMQQSATAAQGVQHSSEVPAVHTPAKTTDTAEPPAVAEQATAHDAATETPEADAHDAPATTDLPAEVCDAPTTELSAQALARGAAEAPALDAPTTLPESAEHNAVPPADGVLLQGRGNPSAKPSKKAKLKKRKAAKPRRVQPQTQQQVMLAQGSPLALYLASLGKQYEAPTMARFGEFSGQKVGTEQMGEDEQTSPGTVQTRERRRRVRLCLLPLFSFWHQTNSLESKAPSLMRRFQAAKHRSRWTREKATRALEAELNAHYNPEGWALFGSLMVHVAMFLFLGCGVVLGLSFWCFGVAALVCISHVCALGILVRQHQCEFERVEVLGQALLAYRAFDHTVHTALSNILDVELVSRGYGLKSHGVITRIDAHTVPQRRHSRRLRRLLMIALEQQLELLRANLQTMTRAVSPIPDLPSSTQSTSSPPSTASPTPATTPLSQPAPCSVAQLRLVQAKVCRVRGVWLSQVRHLLSPSVGGRQLNIRDTHTHLMHVLCCMVSHVNGNTAFIAQALDSGSPGASPVRASDLTQHLLTSSLHGLQQSLRSGVSRLELCLQRVQGHASSKAGYDVQVESKIRADFQADIQADIQFAEEAARSALKMCTQLQAMPILTDVPKPKAAVAAVQEPLVVLEAEPSGEGDLQSEMLAAFRKLQKQAGDGGGLLFTGEGAKAELAREAEEQRSRQRAQDQEVAAAREAGLRASLHMVGELQSVLRHRSTKYLVRSQE